MKKSRIISTVTSVLLLQSLMIMSGCGGGNGSSSNTSATTPSSGGSSSSMTGSDDSTTSSSVAVGETVSSSTSDSGASSSVAGGEAVPSTVYVATLYPIVDATVVSGKDEKEALIIGSGTYEFSRILSATYSIVAKDGVVDLNGNGQADHGEPYAPEFRATGDSNVLNPFTTMLANGMSSEEILSLYPSLAPYAPNFYMREFPHDTVKDTLKATIHLAIEQYDADHVLDEADIDKQIGVAISFEKLNKIYQMAMYKINKLYTDEMRCLPLAPCYYPGITPTLDVNYVYDESGSSSSSSVSSVSSSSSSSSSSSTGKSGGSTTPIDPY